MQDGLGVAIPSTSYLCAPPKTGRVVGFKALHQFLERCCWTSEGWDHTKSPARRGLMHLDSFWADNIGFQIMRISLHARTCLSESSVGVEGGDWCPLQLKANAPSQADRVMEDVTKTPIAKELSHSGFQGRNLCGGFSPS